jgi:hypothetical protein
VKGPQDYLIPLTEIKEITAMYSNVIKNNEK